MILNSVVNSVVESTSTSVDPGGSTPSYDPATIYALGGQGLWLKSANFGTTYFQDAAGAVPVTAVEQSVRRANDKSGRGNNVTSPSDAARPLLSARKNVLTKSEQLDDIDWTKESATVTANTSTAPDGTLTAETVTANTTNSYVYQTPNLPAGQYTASVYVKGSGSVAFFLFNNVDGAAAGTSAAFTLTAAWQRISFAVTASSNISQCGVGRITATGTATSFDVWGFQLERGLTATSYQRVNTATDYDITGFLHYLKLDGTDDGLGTAAFAAGTLTNNMDCFMLVRRDSAASAILAFQTDTTTPYFGVVESGSGLAASTGAGTPTYYVNGVAVPGGTATTRAQLNTALPVGAVAVLEVRNLDLSAWTAFKTGNYTGYSLNGAIAEVILGPAQSAASRTQIREYLAAQAGITL